MVANAPGASGGFSSISPTPEITGGYSHVMDMFKKTRGGKVDGRTVGKLYKRWLKSMGQIL